MTLPCTLYASYQSSVPRQDRLFLSFSLSRLFINFPFLFCSSPTCCLFCPLRYHDLFINSIFVPFASFKFTFFVSFSYLKLVTFSVFLNDLVTCFLQYRDFFISVFFPFHPLVTCSSLSSPCHVCALLFPGCFVVTLFLVHHSLLPAMSVNYFSLPALTSPTCCLFIIL